MGNFNARTGALRDFIANDINRFDVHDHNQSISFPDQVSTNRNNRDSTISPFGTRLVEMCLASNLKFLNGRTKGDLLGQFTCYTINGKSAVDYVITSETIIPKILYFTVEPPTYNTCHSPLSFALKIQSQIRHTRSSAESLNPLPKKFKWQNINDDFENILKSDQFLLRGNCLNSKPISLM